TLPYLKAWHGFGPDTCTQVNSHLSQPDGTMAGGLTELTSGVRSSAAKDSAMNQLPRQRRILPAKAFSPPLLAVLLGTLCPAAALAQARPQDLTNASLEDLMNIE